MIFSRSSGWILLLVISAIASGIPPGAVGAGEYEAFHGPDLYRAKVLYRAGDREAGAAILRPLLADPDWRVRTYALGAIAEIRGRELLPEIHRALMDPSFEVREAASRLLQQIGDASSRAPLRQALRDPIAIVRSNAAEALVRVAGEEDFAVLEVLLQSDPDPSVRALTAGALGQAEGAFAVPLLLLAVGDTDPVVRMHAAEALGAQGRAEVRPILNVLASEDPDSRVRLSAQQALARIPE